ncbi:MAG: HD domain-containing protein [Clostridia bacterium]|jgi:hypothetical protein|nr:HD domain-containing protein [Clostridia bacterium]
MDRVDINKKMVKSLLSSIDRKGIPELVAWLEQSDYFVSPASTIYHGAFEGGLCDHSLKVMHLFDERNIQTVERAPEDTVIICGLLHDLCKVGAYKKFIKEQKVIYRHTENHASRYYHATLSLDIIEGFIELTPLEHDIILYHMGLFGCHGRYCEYSSKDMYTAIADNCLVQIFASCDTEEAHSC